MSAKTEAILQRAAWTFILTFASIVAVLSPTGLWSVGWIPGALGSAVIAVAVSVKNAMITPPEAKN